jgi:hypothetical protein
VIVRWAGPEGVREWSYEPGELSSADAEAIEDVTGWTYEEFGQALWSGSVRAKRALLWVLRRRDDPRLPYDQVEFKVQDMFVGLAPDEADVVRAALTAGDVPPLQQMVLEQLLGAVRDDAVRVAGDTPAGDQGKAMAGADATGSST